MNVGEHSVIEAAGVHAERIAILWWVMLAVASAVFISCMITLAFVSFRRKDGGQPPERDRTAKRAVAWSTAATVAILFVFLAASYVTGRPLGVDPGGDPLEVDVVGRQWWWEFRYAGDTPGEMVITANELHIPVGRAVKLRLSSPDVIHSIWIPSLHGKKDLVPGTPVETWLRADRAGFFRGICAEFCGHQHAKMAFDVIAESPKDFARWLSAQRAPAAPPATDFSRAGQRIFVARCALCHAIGGSVASATAGPDLTNLASRRTIAAGTLPNTRDNLARWIVDPHRIKPGVRMPANALDSASLGRLLDYLQGLR